MHNVLIIDDNAKNIQLAANVLKNTNLYTIFFALSAEDGLKKLQNNKIWLNEKYGGLNNHFFL
jgi:CheY-like chemotaxis protein